MEGKWDTNEAEKLRREQLKIKQAVREKKQKAIDEGRKKRRGEFKRKRKNWKG